MENNIGKKALINCKKKVVYLDLEKDTDRLNLHDAESYLAQHSDKFVIIDEVQYMPELYRVMRPLIDDKRVPQRFLLTGSASPDLVKGVSESLGARNASIESSH